MKKEFSYITSHKGLMFTLLAVLLIPFVYSFSFLTSAWDPYGNTGKIPVAVVNLDQPAQLEGQTIQAGNDTIKELHDNDKLEWHFVTEKAAEKGLKNNKYYTVVTIPKDFSANAATVLDAKPKKMKLSYETNGSLNYVSEIISQVGADTLLSQIKAKVTNAFVTTLFGKVNQIGDKLKIAADGSGQLKDGIAQYTNGVERLDGGLTQLHDKVPTLSNGIGQLTAGGWTLNDGLSNLSSGTKQLQNDGTSVLANGLNEMQSKTKDLPGGVKQLLDGMQQLEYLTLEERNGNPSMPDGVAQLQAGITRMQNAVAQQQKLINSAFLQIDMGLDPSTFGVTAQDLGLQPGQKAYPLYHYEKISQNAASQADADLQNLKTSLTNASPEAQAALAQFEASYQNQKTANDSQYANAKNNLAFARQSITSQDMSPNGDPKGLYKALSLIQEKLTTLNNELNGGVDVVGHDTYKSAVNQLLDGLKKLNGAAPQLMEGVNKLTEGANTINNKMGIVVDGSSKLFGGSSTLANGLTQLNSNVPTLSSGVQQLFDGANQLKGNNDRLNGGINQLATGLSDGYQQVTATKLTAMTADMFAEPATSNHEFYTTVDNYGAALAPFVLALALFIAVIIFNFAYPMTQTAGDSRSHREWLLSKIAMGTIVAVVMAVIEATLMKLVGLQVDHMLGFYGITILFALAAMYLTQMLSYLFGGLGIFISLGLLTLSGSGGLFPAETVSPLFEATQKFLPMTYAISGYRQMISSGIASSTVAGSITVLAVLAMASLAIMLVVSNMKNPKLASKWS